MSFRFRFFSRKGDYHTSTQRAAIIGAGGHGAVVASTLIAVGHAVVAFYDNDPSKWGTRIFNFPVVGPVSEITAQPPSPAVIAIGNNETRKRFAQELDLEWTTVVHPFSWVHPDVPLGPGTVVCAGAIVQPGATIGSHVILNTRASVDHHCRVGDFVHIAVAHMGGGASVDEGVFLALGSTVLPQVHVGAWATVGAGAVAFKDVPPGTTVVGTPARPIPLKQQ